MDQCNRECLALIADTFIGARVARELGTLINRRGRPHCIVSDNGTELTSRAVLQWAQDRNVNGITSRRASRAKTVSPKA